MKRLLNQCLLVTLFLILITACATMQSRWEEAESTNTIPAYEEFLMSSPEGIHADEARSRIVKLYSEQNEAYDTLPNNSIVQGTYLGTLNLQIMEIAGKEMPVPWGPDSTLIGLKVHEAEGIIVWIDGKGEKQRLDINKVYVCTSNVNKELSKRNFLWLGNHTGSGFFLLDYTYPFGSKQYSGRLQKVKQKSLLSQRGGTGP